MRDPADIIAAAKARPPAGSLPPLTEDELRADLRAALAAHTALPPPDPLTGRVVVVAPQR